MIARLARRLRSTASAGSLTPTQVSVLFTVVRQGPLALSDLGELESLHPTMLSRVVGALADAGLLVAQRRQRRPARACRSPRAPPGAGCASGSTPSATAALGSALARLDPAAREAVTAALGGLEELAELLR